MRPDEIRAEGVADVAVMGYSQAGERELHTAYEQAGTTWWLETLHDQRGSFDDMLSRVTAGP